MITRDDIAFVYRTLIKDQSCMTALDAVQYLLLKSLSPGQEAAFTLLQERGSVSSQTLRTKWGWKANYSGNILKQLYQFGLAEWDWDTNGVKVYRNIWPDKV